VQRVRVDGARTVQDFLQGKPEKVQHLRELVHSASLRSLPAREKNTAMHYEARFSLTGQGASVCIPTQLWHEEYELFTPSAENATVPSLEGKFSGLIVDARGLGGKPALVCRLFDEQARLVYGPSLVSRQVGQNQGIVGYKATMQEARTSTRVGQLPLEVRAQSLHADSVSDFVLSAHEVQPLWNTANISEIFSQGKVIIVLQNESGDQVVEYPLDQ
jgi:hypothetical protein